MANPQVSQIETLAIVEKVVSDPEWLQWMKMRYSSRGHAIYCYTTARKYLVEVLKDPSKLKQLNHRRARAIFEAIAAVRDYAKLRYGIELQIDTKWLRKFMPPKPIEEVTQAILEYELEEGEGKDIVSQALEAIEKLKHKGSKFTIPVLIAFFTGLRSTEIKYLLDNWNTRRKIEVVEGVVLIELNYDRQKKKAYITLIPKNLKLAIDEWHPSYVRDPLGKDWKDHLRKKHGINIGLFRKAWQAITAKYLDKAERELLEGHLKSIQVRHYIKHIKSIAKRYLEAFNQYLHLIDELLGSRETDSQRPS